MSTDTYTHGHHAAVLRSHRSRTAANSAAYLLPQLRPGATLLDVGCGPATLTADLAGHIAPGHVVGIDVSESVIAQATQLLADRGVRNVSLRAGDFRELGTEPARFGVVHAHQVLQHLSDPIGALRAMGDLAADGGVIAVRDSDYPAMFWAPDDAALARWSQIYCAVARHNRAEPAAGRHLVGWAAEAGLCDIAYSTSTWSYATRAELDWLCELWAERISAPGSALAEQAIRYGIAEQRELYEIAAGWRAFASRPHAVFVIPHGEVLARPPSARRAEGC